MSELARLELSGDDVVVARLSGEIDMSNANEVGDELSSAVPNTALGLVLDLTALTYLDSSGVHLVFDLAERLRTRQQQLRVVVPAGAPIRRVLRIVELDDSVPVLASVDEAVEQIRAAAA
ncbi:MAG TPA: STAS domain-containing protein [Thermoleophilaceae bacterium]|jgi:anti-anti-sigma factor|nr:STAS domain-containing protein [Thermoleophilaceae bacterium]